jgi:hypothetical protein
MGKNINAVKKNGEALLEASKVCPEVNTEKTTCLYLITKMQDKIII